jgi:hypothetical protein
VAGAVPGPPAGLCAGLSSAELTDPGQSGRQDFYRAVAADPAMAVLDADCEEMCYFFAHLHHERFGGFPDTGSGISRETGRNPDGW